MIAVARRKNKDLTAALAQAERASKGTLHFVPFDLGEINKIPGLVRALRKEFGPLFGLVNNAALGAEGVLAMMHNAKIEEQVRLNTLSPIVLTKYVVRGMMSAGAGRIVNVASIIGATGYSGLAAYAATKTSMLGFTRSLAREVGRLRHQCQCGVARVFGDRYDEHLQRRTAQANRAQDGAAPLSRSRRRG